MEHCSNTCTIPQQFMNFISVELKEKLEKDFDVKIFYFDEYKERLNGKEEDVQDYASSGSNEIFLGKYSSPKVELLCLFHELGHVVWNRENIIPSCYLYMECMAWDRGIHLIQEYGCMLNYSFDFCDYNSDENAFIRKNLASYDASEYNDLRNT